MWQQKNERLQRNFRSCLQTSMESRLGHDGMALPHPSNTTTSNTTPTLNQPSSPLTTIIKSGERTENRVFPCFANLMPTLYAPHYAHVIECLQCKD